MTKRRSSKKTDRPTEALAPPLLRYIVHSTHAGPTDMASQLGDMAGVVVIGSYAPEHVVVEATAGAADVLQSSAEFSLEEDMPHILIR